MEDESKKTGEGVSPKSSPNIKGSDVDLSFLPSSNEEVEKKTIVDGIPIDEKDIKYRAKDIKDKDKSGLFIKVEGAKRIAKKKEREAKKKDEDLLKRLLDAENEKKAKKEAEYKEAKKWAQDKIKKYKSQKAQEKHDKEAADRANRREAHREKRKLFFKKYKYALIVVVLVITAATGIITGPKIAENAREYQQEKEYQEIIESQKGEPTEVVFGEGDINDYETIIGYFHEITEYQGEKEALKYLNEKITLADKKASKTARAKYHNERAFYLYMNHVFGKEKSDSNTKKLILEDAYLAEKLSPDYETARNIAMYEDDFGSKNKAAEYEQKAEERSRNAQ